MDKTQVSRCRGFVGIIPARSGSERLPGKNLLPLHGKPLIRWTLDAAIESEVFDHLIVTSDDELILKEGKAVNAITIKRPPALASDTATTTDTILHALDAVEALGIYPERFMLLQPTSPLRSADDIRNSAIQMNENESDSIISVCRVEHSPLWCGTLSENCSMEKFLHPEVLNLRSQDLPIYYRLNGAIYLIQVEKFRAERNYFIPNSHAFEMPTERSVDIDTFADFVCATALMANKIVE